MSKTISFYSKEELKELNALLSTKEPINDKLIADFLQKTGRSKLGVINKLYNMRNVKSRDKHAKKYDNGKVTLRSHNRDLSAVKLAKGEFKIPINGWKISQEEGKFYFIVNF